MTGRASDSTGGSDHDRSGLISSELLDVLAESQRLGLLGDRSVEEAAEHSRGFVRALEGVSGIVADIGAGGGLPGLVIGHDRADLRLLLIDRRAKRTDFLRRVVRRMGWNDRISVTEGDVQDVIAQRPGEFDAVVARGFGPPDHTLRMALELVGPGGRVVISEPPMGDRWDPDLLLLLGVERIDGGSDTVATFRRLGVMDVSRET